MLRNSFILLLLGLCLTSCGGGSTSPAASTTPSTSSASSTSSTTATVNLVHDLSQSALLRADSLLLTGYDSTTVVYGPYTLAKAAVLTVQVPVTVSRLHIDYSKQGRIIANGDVALALTNGAFITVTGPLLTLLTPATTLDRTILPSGSGTYKKLSYQAPWSQVVRTDLQAAQSGRETRRVPLLCMPHFSDVHIIDAQSPLRIEFLRGVAGFKLPISEFQAAWRPQETLTMQVALSMVTQMNAIGSGPITGRPFDCAVFTGDLGDNRHVFELMRFLNLMDGGKIVPASGDAVTYQGVQDQVAPFLSQYWHPDAGQSDQYKSQYGFPSYPGLLQSVVTPFTSPGLATPWYTCYGNHDQLVQGNFPVRDNAAPPHALDTIATSGSKLLALPYYFELFNKVIAGSGIDLFIAAFGDPFGALPGGLTAFVDAWNSSLNLTRMVTADPSRHLLNEVDFINAHLNTPPTPGPVGHGFSAQNAATGQLYYTFTPAPGFLGITLDTANPAGENNGSIDIPQLNWLEQQLRQVSSHYYDLNGNLVSTGNPDKLVVLFSHHSLETLDNPLVDTDFPGVRVLNAQLEATLHRYPNVIAWLNGHTHYSRIYAHPDPTGRTQGFWEVNSPSLIDFPQEARIVEFADNRDGTLSIFATLVDTAAPATPSTTSGPYSTSDLAAISRELAANDPEINVAFQVGQPGDRNVELLIKAPFATSPRQ